MHAVVCHDERVRALPHHPGEGALELVGGTPRPREAGDEPGPNRIAGGKHDNGDRCRRSHGGLSRGRALGNDDIYLETDQLGRQAWKALVFPVRPAELDCNVFTLDVAKVTQACPQCLYPTRDTGT